MKKIPITIDGYKKLQEELKTLKIVERPNVINAISEARLLGDLSENAEYHAAKEKQGFIESKITELEEKLRRIEIVDTSKLSGNQVKFGAIVTILDENTNEEYTYKIVGGDESDISKGLLSIISPLAKALVGKHIGEITEVNTPMGRKEYLIQKIKFN